MSKSRKLIRKYYPYVVLGGAFLALLFWNAFYLENWLDSDMAAEMMFSKLLAEKGKVFADTGWYYSTEFRFLYTHLIMGPLFRICGSWHVIRMVTNVLFYLLLLGSYFYMMAALPVGREQKILGAAALMLPFSETMMLHMHMGNTYMSHVIILFFYLGLFLRLAGDAREQNCREKKDMVSPEQKPAVEGGERNGKKRYLRYFLWAAYMALSVICGVSGVRYMLALQCPLVFASIWYITGGAEFSALRKEPCGERIRAVFLGERFRFLMASFAGALGCVAGYGINVCYVSRTYSFQTYESTNFIDVYQGVFLERLQDAFGALLMLFGYIPGKSVLSLRGIISMMAFGLLFVLGYAAYKAHMVRQPMKRFIVLLFYSSFLLNSFVFVFTDSTLVPRYYITTVILLIPVVIFYLEEEKKPLDRYIVVFVLASCLLLASAKTGLSMMGTDKNAEKKVMAQELVERGYGFGYATYWNANIIQELSDGAVELANLHREEEGSLTLFRWSSMERYYEPDYPEGKVFLLLTEEEEGSLFRRAEDGREESVLRPGEEDGVEENGRRSGNALLRAGREDFRRDGFVVYCYEENEDFLEALQEAFP